MGHNRRLWLGRRFLFPAKAGPNTGFHLTAAPVALWATRVTEAQPQVNPDR
jgi:hypothetical protein